MESLLFLDLELRLAHVAQSVEHFLGKEEVTGSNPVVGSSRLASIIINIKLI